MTFDNHDSRIRYYDLILQGSLEGLPRFELPEGYRFVFYQEGDREDWISIELSAKELESREQGREVWKRYYGGHEEELKDRMLFVENSAGEKVATATAYYDPFGRDVPSMGYLHWVAVRRDHQGKGLSKPLISRTLARLGELGYRQSKITTQTTTWLACKIYLDFGFRPTPENAMESRKGWEIIRTLTDHPALESFSKAGLEEILAGERE